MVPDGWFDLKVEYREMQGQGRVKLSWSSLQANITKQVIPEDNLYRMSHIRGSPFNNVFKVESAGLDIIGTGIDLVNLVQANSPTASASGGLGSNSTINGTTLVTAICGVPFYLPVRALDSFGNVITRSGLNFAIYIVDSRTSTRIDGVVRQKATGEYIGSVTPRVSGTNLIHLLFENVDIAGSPLSIDVKPAPASITASYVIGNLHGGIVGTYYSFFIFSRDEFFNSRTAGGDDFTVELEGPEQAPRSVNERFKGSILDKQDGSYYSEYTALTRGFYNLTVKLKGVQLSSSPFRVYFANERTDPLHTVATGSTLSFSRVAVDSVFFIQTADYYDNKQILGGDLFQAYMTHNQQAVTVGVNITDFGNGTYQGNYFTTLAGDWTLSVLVYEQKVSTYKHIFKSPFSTYIEFGATAQNFSYAYGDGLNHSTVNVAANFFIQSKDEYNNIRYRGGSIFTAAIIGSDQNEAGVVTDLTTGNYSVRIVPYKIGTYNMFVRFNGYDVLGSPYQHNVSLLSNYSLIEKADKVFVEGFGPSYESYLYGPNMSVSVAGHLKPLFIQARDIFQNNLYFGNDKIIVELSGKGWCKNDTYIAAECSNFERSERECTRVPKCVWKYSQFKYVCVPRDSCPNTITLLSTKQVVSGVKDDSTYAGIGHQGFPGHLEVIPNDFKNGTYNISYTPIVAGDYDLAAFVLHPGGLKGTYFENIDFSYPVVSRIDQSINFDWDHGSPAPHVPTDYFSVRWSGKIKVDTDEPITFKLDAVDGVRLYIEEQIVIDAWSSNKKTVTADVTLRKDAFASIRVEFLALTLSASITLYWKTPSKPFFEIVPPSVLFYVEQLNNSPLNITVLPNPVCSAPASNASGPALTLITAGQTSSFIVDARDQFGNRQLWGGQDFSINITYIAADNTMRRVPSSLLDLQDGRYQVTYTTFYLTNYTVEVLHNRTLMLGSSLLLSDPPLAHINGSPFTVPSVPNVLVVYTSIVVSDLTSPFRAGKTSRAFIYPKDLYGNTRPANNSKEITVLGIRRGAPVGETPVKGSLVIDKVNNRYLVEYTPISAGIYDIVVANAANATFDFQSYNVTIVPSEVYAPYTYAYGSGLLQAVTNYTSSFTIQAVDILQNNVSGGGEYFVVTMESSDRTSVIANITDLNNGRYQVDYVPRTAGSLKIQISLIDILLNGLTATYFNNRWLIGPPYSSQILPTVNISAGTGLVYSSGYDYIGVRYTGYLRPLTQSQLVTFYLVSQDAASLYIDGAYIFGMADGNGVERQVNGSVYMAKSRVYSIQIDYSESSGAASLLLYWSSPLFAKQPVPSSALFPVSRPISNPLHYLYIQNDPNPCSGIRTLSALSGSIQDGTSGLRYNPLSFCAWSLHIGTPKNLTITFNYLDVEADTDCIFDYLNVYSGTSDVGTLIGSFCGSQTGRTVTFPVLVIDLYFMFRSDSNVEGDGFSLTYSLV
eukprot:GILI01010435.1.p1 GENE.GILI01010435.1~~GILI01010435.1.p1  ORF type:complete len:1533 (-),score=330.90 GILI01010435.1:154-4497(-)